MNDRLETICIMCPMGCPIVITRGEDGAVNVEGNTCKRGHDYGVQEFTAPMRTVTSLVKSTSGAIQPVKTSAPVPKERIFDVLQAIRTVVATEDTVIGDVLMKNVLGLGVDIVATRDAIKM